MSHNPVPRTAGIGLVVYGLGTAIPFMFSGAPGGTYSASGVADYVTPGHHAVVFALWYVGALAALGLVVMAVGIRRLAGTGPFVAGLAITGAAVSVVGAFVAGGVEVAMAEGGSQIRAGVAGPVVYTLTEIGNLLAICAPALCIGVAAVVLAVRGPLPTWLRAFSVIAGICGILAPFFFTYFVFLLWTVIAGVAWAAGPVKEPATDAAPSLV